MRHKDPELMKKIAGFVEEFYGIRNRMPSTAEIANELHVAKSTAYTYLVAMDKKGMLTYRNGEIHADYMNRSGSWADAPVVGFVPCGELTTEEENVELHAKLPTALFGDGPFFILHAKGDSMEDEGIEAGDLLVIRQNPSPEVGELVIALDEENQNTLKRFGGFDKKTGKAILQYRNKAVYGDKVILVKTLVSQGVVSHVIKKK